MKKNSLVDQVFYFKHWPLLLLVFLAVLLWCYKGQLNLRYTPKHYFPVIGSVDTKEKVIALTFDDGPDKIFTQQILDILKKNDVKATFFLVGQDVRAHPDLVQEEFADNDEVANHSYTHPMFSKLDDNGITSELTKTNNAIYKVIHAYPVLFRPPYGVTSPSVKRIAANLGFKIITWSYLVNDYDVKKTSAEKIASSIINNASPGGIMAMHDCCINRSKTVAALPVIIQGLRDKGYKFVTVAELLNIQPYHN